MAIGFQEKLSRLLEIASTQQGLFTAAQAEEAGFRATNFTYHVQKGLWVREVRGIYRLKNFPQDQVKAQYVLYFLWSRDHRDKPQGVFSHETALAIYELSDVMPSKIHMTVPTTFRKSAKTPPILELHYRKLEKAEVQGWEGLTVTKPFQTILDLIDDGRTSEEFVHQAFVEGSKRGLIPIKEINSEKIPKDLKKKLQLWLKRDRDVHGSPNGRSR